MNFLEKLDYMMDKMSINKSKLSAMSGVPYTTIDGFYKKGYANTKMSTIRKIAAALDVSLDYLIDDNITDEYFRFTISDTDPQEYSDEEALLIDSYRKLNHAGKAYIQQTMAMAVMAYTEKSNAAPGMEAAK